MVTPLIIIIILFLLTLTSLVVNLYKDESEFVSSILTILTVFFLTGIIIIVKDINKNENNIKVDLPEEIYQVRSGDTLYITKRTKDSIYLGFKQLKKE